MGKKCYGCRIEKDLSQFRKDKKLKDGRGTKCENCDRDYDIKRRKRLKEFWTNNNAYLLFPSKVKKCSVCKKEKSIYDFGKNKNYATGIASSCKECVLEKFRLRVYGVAKTDEKCWICKSDKFLTVDHSHKHGQVRGTLCRTCNLGVAYFKDDISLLLQAIEYLKR